MNLIEVERLGVSRFLKYEVAMNVLEAREMLSQMAVADYPHLKKEQRQRLHRDVFTRANPNIFDAPKRVVTLQDVARMLGNGRR